MTDPLSCPFCGGEPRAENYSWSINVGREWWVFTCNACGASAEKFQRYADALAAWNRRA